mmetsp:Transcript_15275/g.50182  ORF Transcript_15275/g.50182 Transcript_15275/m.50182 type:complete len:280 (-) Transcript_15275:292-1131(-)
MRPDDVHLEVHRRLVRADHLLERKRKLLYAQRRHRVVAADGFVLLERWLASQTQSQRARDVILKSAHRPDRVAPRRLQSEHFPYDPWSTASPSPHLAEPRAKLAQHLPRDLERIIQPKPVCSKPFHKAHRRLEHVCLHPRVFVVETRQIRDVPPTRVIRLLSAARIRPERKVFVLEGLAVWPRKPVAVRAFRAILEQRGKSVVRATSMIVHAIKNNANTAIVACRDEALQGFRAPEHRVNLDERVWVIAVVAPRRKYWAKVYTVDSQVLDVAQLGRDAV